MRALGILVVTACSGSASTAPPPPPATSPPVQAPAPVADACAADAARLQPSLEGNLALFDKWGFPSEVAEKLDLASAPAELDRIPPKLPVVTMTPQQIELLGQALSPSSLRARLTSLGAREIVLAIDRTTGWPAVVRLLHELPTGLRAHVAFAVDTSIPRIGDPAAVQQLRAGGPDGFRVVARDVTQRCPAVGDLFMVRTDEIAGVFVRDAGAALRGCKCAVSATELANLYEALVVPRYLAARSIKLGRAGVAIGGGRSSTFGDIARTFASLPADAEVSVTVDR